MEPIEKITAEQIAQFGVVALPDKLTGKPDDNKRLFDRLVRELVAVVVNEIIDQTNVIVPQENAREEAETDRVTAEKGRVLAEESRGQAESRREEAEGQRVENETARQDAEGDRASAESARRTAEEDRASAEEQRTRQETARVSTEEDRADAERQRAEKEAERLSAETARTQAEQGRSDAETARNLWEDYDPEKIYDPGNKVAFQGSSYLNINHCQGVLPDDSSCWRLIAKKGDTGEQGPAGTGSGDMLVSIYDPKGRKQDIFQYVDDHKEEEDAHKEQFDKKADLENGKVPASQLPEMDYDPAGSADAVKDALMHKIDHAKLLAESQMGGAGGATGELEDLTVRLGSFVNSGAGWNSFRFPIPFDAPPAVVLQPVDFVGWAEIKNVTEEGFLYCLRQPVYTAGQNGTAGSVSTGEYFTGAGTGSSTSHSKQVLVNGVTLPGAPVLPTAENKTTAAPVVVHWMAMEENGDEALC